MSTSKNLEKQSLEGVMDDLLGTDVQDRMTMFQLKHFVVGKEFTVQAKLWRCLQEMQSRRTDLKNLKLEIEETNDRIALIDIEIRRLSNSLAADHRPELTGVPLDGEDIEELNIKIRQATRRQEALRDTLESLTKKRAQTRREAQFFVQEFQNLGGKSVLKSMDDPEAQLEFWNENYKQKLNMALLLQKPLDPELVRLILCLQDDAPIKQQTVRLLEQIQSRAIEQHQMLEGHRKALSQETK